MYLVHAPPLIDAGYAPLALIPRSKKPGICERGVWRPREDWPTAPIIDPRASVEARESVRNAKVGLLLGSRSKDVIRVDIDDATKDEQAALLAALPHTDIRNRGSRGEGLFYTCPGAVTTQFRIGGRLVVEILGEGRQAVLPPSTHPDTGRPYAWTGAKTLLDGAPPAIAHVAPVRIIKQVLAPFGYVTDAPVSDVDHDVDSSAGSAAEAADATPWRALNDAAMGNLDAWVSALRLYGCIRRQDGSYAAVATWRPSSSGRPTEQRKRNLGINPKGIKDFGTGQSYSPIDLVMAALGLDFAGATDWLDERLGWSGGGPEIRFETPGKEKSAPPDEPAEESPEATGEEVAVPEMMRGAWMDGDAPPAPPAWLTKKLMPRQGLGLIAAQAGSYKTFLAINEALCTMVGRPFAGRKVVVTGGVLFIALEDEETLGFKLQATKIHAGIDREQKLPFIATNKCPKLLKNKRVDPKAVKQLKEAILYAAAQMRARFDVPLRQVFIDNLMRAAGYGDENASAEVQQAVDGLTEVFKEAGIAIRVIDHHGKDPLAGPRGSSVKRDGVDNLITVEKSDDVPYEGQVRFSKVRGAASGGVVKFSMVRVELGFDADGDPIDALAVEWGEAVSDSGQRAKPAPQRPYGEQVFCKALNVAIKVSPVKVPGGALMGALQRDVRREFYSTYLGEDDEGGDPAQARRRAFKRSLRKLLSAAEVGVLLPGDEATPPTDENTLLWFTING